MITIVQRDGTTKTVAPQTGSTVLDICRSADIYEIEAACGGNCSCATCHVYVQFSGASQFSPMEEAEGDLLDYSDHRADNSRLACQLVVTDADADFTVVIAPEG